MGDDEDGLGLAVAVDELLDQVGLPVQRVVVVSRLLGESEAEEVRGEGGVVGLPFEQQAPVVGARWEPVQEEQERTVAAAIEDVDAAAAELLVPAAFTPGLNASGQIHRYRPFFLFFFTL